MDGCQAQVVVATFDPSSLFTSALYFAIPIRPIDYLAFYRDFIVTDTLVPYYSIVTLSKIASYFVIAAEFP